MKFPTLALPILILSCVSCDKIKELADSTSATMVDELKRQVGVEEPKDAVTAAAAEPGATTPDDSQVDRTDAGVIFRKDLPFPKKVEVKTTIEKKISARFFHSSQLGSKVENVQGTQKQVHVIERDGPQVTYTLKENKFTVPSQKPEVKTKEVKNPLQQVPPSKDPVTFQFDGSKWKASESSFKTMVLSKQLSPVFGQLLVENALVSRPLWFSATRIKVGDEISVNDQLLPMFVSGNANGKLTVKLESIDEINGHPCGVFAVKGDFSRKQFPDFQGGLTDEDVTIESGKMWLSLLYPVILKEELQTIQTFRPGGNSAITGRGQGTVEVTITREWKAEGLNEAIREAQ